ncbi:trypsin-like peptidase domain-containing protein [Sporolactobacillus sp. CPB3-1]|uniref:Trypsin-like peptidase domain-containing protein n=1 Tax=Sporolactobacillus mangiferae TaxID=2940498 RepID=A0ABT0MD41_9BACL|nr:trypsin-like peptidase domain-containing protein [Sporolactobacillus mangiferae]MCL1632179.1 trypsin-like peptidase domain-containing protein [Sporolactobacillus mangiferae]
MGYYDDEDNHTESKPESDNPSRQQRESRLRGGWFLSGFIGAIVGMVCLLIFAPILSDLGVFPYQVTGSQNSNTTGSATFNRQVNVDVTSSVTDAVDKVSPAVVAVINLQKANFFDNKYTESGIGSGIIYKKDNQYAYVVTNNHVVSGAEKVEVRLSDELKTSATVLGKDSLYDLAVLRIPAKNVKTVAEFGNSSKLKRGEPAIAIGNPLGFSGSVTEGIISSTNRTIQVDSNNASIEAQVLQTDAAINPGNSGGALVNIGGQVIGINSSKIASTGSSTDESVEGIGFAIPINVAKPIINELETNRKIERPMLGISIVDLSMVPSEEASQLEIPSKIKTGLVVTDVQRSSPAAGSGLEAGDVITEINGYKIKSYIDFSTYMYTKLHAGQNVTIKYYRMGKEHTTKLTLGSKTFS